MYWLTGITGVILMAAPYMFAYANSPAALWTSLSGGFVVLVASLWEGLQIRKENWEYWVAGIVGILAILSPFIFGFGSYTAMWTTVILGAIIALMAGFKLWSGGSLRI